MTTRKTRILGDTEDALCASSRIVTRLILGTRDHNGHELVSDDLHALRTAANQARQAAQYLDNLCGMLENELD